MLAPHLNARLLRFQNVYATAKVSAKLLVSARVEGAGKQLIALTGVVQPIQPTPSAQVTVHVTTEQGTAPATQDGKSLTALHCGVQKVEARNALVEAHAVQRQVDAAAVKAGKAMTAVRNHVLKIAMGMDTATIPQVCAHVIQTGRVQNARSHHARMGALAMASAMPHQASAFVVTTGTTVQTAAKRNVQKIALTRANAILRMVSVRASPDLLEWTAQESHVQRMRETPAQGMVNVMLRVVHASAMEVLKVMTVIPGYVLAAFPHRACSALDMANVIGKKAHASAQIHS